MKETSIQNLQYKDYVDKFNYKIGEFLPIPMIDKFGLISLLGFISFSVKSKNPTLTTYDILLKIMNPLLTNYMSNKHFIHFLYNVCTITDDFTIHAKGPKDFELFGLKTQKEIIDQINNILEKWCPF